MNEYERRAYQQNKTGYDRKSALQRYADNMNDDMNDDMIDTYIKEHRNCLDGVENRDDIVMTDKQLDAIVEKLLNKII